MKIRYKSENPNLINYINADYKENKSDQKFITNNVFLLTEKVIS
jgi:hypothetical protein